MKGPAAVFLLLALGALWLFGRGGGREAPFVRRDPLTAQPKPIAGTRPDIGPRPGVTAVPTRIGGRPALIDIDINGGARPPVSLPITRPITPGIPSQGPEPFGPRVSPTARPTRFRPISGTDFRNLQASERDRMLDAADARLRGETLTAEGRFILFPGADRIQ